MNHRRIIIDTSPASEAHRGDRDYLDKPIPDESLQRILEAGRLAPSSKNSQPWHFIVIRDIGYAQEDLRIDAYRRTHRKGTSGDRYSDGPSKAPRDRWHTCGSEYGT